MLVASPVHGTVANALEKLNVNITAIMRTGANIWAIFAIYLQYKRTDLIPEFKSVLYFHLLFPFVFTAYLGVNDKVFTYHTAFVMGSVIPLITSFILGKSS